MSKKRIIMLKVGIICYILLAIIFGLSMYGLKAHTANHMASISTNAPLQNNHTTEIVWYHANCHHCKETIPTDYMINKLLFRHVQYRNLDTTYNTGLQLKTRWVGYPLGVKVIRHNDTYRTKPMNMSYKRPILIISMMMIYLTLILIMDILICMFCI